jgi:hypothetical protein
MHRRSLIGTVHSDRSYLVLSVQKLRTRVLHNKQQKLRVAFEEWKKKEKIKNTLFKQRSPISETVLLSGSFHISPVFHFRPFFLLIKLHIDENEYGSLVGNILTGENQSNRRKTCPGAKFFTANLTRIGPRSKPLAWQA